MRQRGRGACKNMGRVRGNDRSARQHFTFFPLLPVQRLSTARTAAPRLIAPAMCDRAYFLRGCHTPPHQTSLQLEHGRIATQKRPANLLVGALHASMQACSRPHAGTTTENPRATMTALPLVAQRAAVSHASTFRILIRSRASLTAPGWSQRAATLSCRLLKHRAQSFPTSEMLLPFACDRRVTQLRGNRMVSGVPSSTDTS